MRTRFMLALILLSPLGACDAAGEEGEECLADGDCADGLVCHKDEHEHDHEEEAKADEEGHEGEAGVCEPEGEHDHDHDHE